MPEATIDLSQLARKLAARGAGRTEATVQSTLHAMLLAAPLGLDPGHLNGITLEQPAGERRRIDIEVGLCVFEVKRDLRIGNVQADAEIQLAGYVQQRSAQTGQRYVGVLTDGCEWHLYRLQGQGLAAVDTLELRPDQPDTAALVRWLEGVLGIGEQLAPTPGEIARLLGAGTPGYLLDIAELKALYAAHRDDPTLRLKRELWARLLTTALGTAFRDDDQLFVQHTLLVLSAEIIAHAVLDIDPRVIAPATLVSGHRFRQSGILGVVESDFFDWVVEVSGGDRFVRTLTRRLTRFDWSHVEHDVLKVLYESVIPTTQRKQLGEYYTPDWLAQQVVERTVTSPLESRVLDPSCGSGTFLFHAVRRYLAAADTAGRSNRDALAGVCSHVLGMDLHPVAVTLARVTYLLALGTTRLAARRSTIAVPVFLGDSLQWGQEETLQTHGSLVVAARGGSGGPELFPVELRFPDSLLADTGAFDTLVSRLAEMSANRPRGSRPPPLEAVLRGLGVSAVEQATLEKTFQVMCDLHDQGRDHIWGYFVRNLARPRWLAREDNRVDVLVGNPPWLSYRYMTGAMQKEFQRLSKERGLWEGAKSATHVDLSALFVVRAIERYLQSGGRFGFVMPYAVLSRQQFRGFRKGAWPRPDGFPVCAEFGPAWDLHAVKPAFFEVPCCVITGRRVDEYGVRAIPKTVELWAGRMQRADVSWEIARPQLRITGGEVVPASTSSPVSPLASRFVQGATLVPRMICFVEKLPAGPLGLPMDEVRVRSRKTASEKEPWRSLPPLEGVLESQFVLPVHLGETILPYQALNPLQGVIPWDGKHLMDASHDRIRRYPGLDRWWRDAEALWQRHRKSESLTLVGRWDYHRGLSGQFVIGGWCPPIRIVYAKAGMYLAAAIVTDTLAVIDHKLYWATCRRMEEARYLCAVLNSDVVTRSVRQFQARGEHNPRDIDKYVWQLPIPEFDADSALHVRLAALGARAEALVASLSLPKTRFEKQRRFVREQLAASETGQEIEVAVAELLGDTQGRSVTAGAGQRRKRR